MLLTLCALLMTAGPPPSLPLPGLHGGDPSAGGAGLFGGLLSDELGKYGVRVLTARQIAAVIGLDRQKQLMGCNEGTACVAELAGAMGADGLIVGDVGKLGDTYAINVKVLSAKDGSTLALH